MPDKPNTERPQRIEDHAKHLAAMVTPKDISSYRKILTDNEQYLAIELARFAAAMAPQEAAGSMDGLREALVDAVKIARSHAMDWNVYKGPGKEFNEAKRDACLELARELENLMGGRAPL